MTTENDGLNLADALDATDQPEIKLPDDPAELARLRGDVVKTDAPAPAAKAVEPEQKELSDEEKADADKVAAGLKKDEKTETPAVEEGDQPRGPDGKFIPKVRFDELRDKKNARIEALEKRTAELQAQLAVKDGPKDVAEAEALLETKAEEYQNFLADGKLKEAQAVFRDINKLNRQIARLELAPVLNELTAASTAAMTLDEVVELYESEFPEFARGASGFNQEMVNEVAELQGAYEASGLTAALALQKAADMVIKAYQLKPASERGKPAKPVDPAADRKAGAVKANLDAASRQPAKMDDLGLDSDKAGAAKLDVSSLTFDEFEKLPESTLRRMRGDHLK